MEKLEYLYNSYINEFKCNYYIVKSTKHFIDVGDSVNVFGVKIDKLSTSGDLISTAMVSDVGINENDVRDFIKVLSDGKVTPITLKEIVADTIIS